MRFGARLVNLRLRRTVAALLLVLGLAAGANAADYGLYSVDPITDQLRRIDTGTGASAVQVCANKGSHALTYR